MPGTTRYERYRIPSPMEVEVIDKSGQRAEAGLSFTDVVKYGEGFKEAGLQ